MNPELDFTELDGKELDFATSPLSGPLSMPLSARTKPFLGQIYDRRLPYRLDTIETILDLKFPNRGLQTLESRTTKFGKKKN